MIFAVRFTIPISLILVASIVGHSAPVQSGQKFLDYETTEVTLVGTIKQETFPGPPNYESIKRGDEPEDYWILHLNQPIDVRGRLGDEMYPAKTNVCKLQLLLENVGGYEHTNFLNKTVKVKGTLSAEAIPDSLEEGKELPPATLFA